MRILQVLCLFFCVAAAQAQSSSPLVLNRTIPLPGVASKFDHLAIDEAGNRLFPLPQPSHAVEVIDLKTDKVQQSITGLGKPHGLAWDAATGSLYVSDGALGELRVYRGNPLTLAGTIKLSDDADDMAYDAVRQLLFVGHGGKDAANPANVAIVNTAEFRLKANVAVSAHPEGIAVDPKSGRVFANIADDGEVAVIDAKTKAITAHRKLTKAADNVPVAFDEKDHLLFVACRKPGMLIAQDAATGKEIAALPAAGGADDLFYDPALGRVYLISGTGEVDAFQVGPEKALHKLGIVPTAAGAKTALFVSSQNLLYLAVPGAGVHPSEIRVYETVKNGISQ